MISTTNVTGEQRLGMGAAAVVMLSEIIKLKPKLSGRTSVGTVPMLLSTVIGRAANDTSVFTIGWMALRIYANQPTRPL